MYACNLSGDLNSPVGVRCCIEELPPIWGSGLKTCNWSGAIESDISLISCSHGFGGRGCILVLATEAARDNATMLMAESS
jgi:hypothetical protein